MSTSTSRPDRVLRVSDIFFAYMQELGVDRIFGNPGTTELPFVDGSKDYPNIDYVLSLHEDIAVAQAIGYARAKGLPGIVNLHVAPGLGHGLSNIYNASRGRVPLLVTVGQQHSKLVAQEPLLAADLARITEPFTKWAHNVTSVDEFEWAVQRAFKEVITPPFAPVMLGFPMDVLFEEVEEVRPPKISRVSAVQSHQDDVERAAQIASSGRNPIMVVGDGVGQAHAWAETVEFAELIGAQVYSESWTTSWPFPTDHPQYVGVASNQSGLMRKQLAEADPLIWLGVYTPAPVSRFDGQGSLLPWGAPTLAIDDSARELGKSHPVDVGLQGDVRDSIARVTDAVRSLITDTKGVEARRDALAEQSGERRRAHAHRLAAVSDRDDLTVEFIAQHLAQVIPDNFVMVDESISNRATFTSTLPFDAPEAYFSTNGGSLGYAIGLASGLHHGGESRRIVTVIGDGSLMYYPQALWGLAERQIPAIVVVLNNNSYRVLKLIVDRMGGPWNTPGDRTPGLDMDHAPIDFTCLAKSMGVKASRSTTPTEFSEALKAALAGTGPHLIEAVVDQPVPIP